MQFASLILIKNNEKVLHIILETQAHLLAPPEIGLEILPTTLITPQLIQDQDLPRRVQEDKRSLLHRIHMRRIKRILHLESLTIRQTCTFPGHRVKNSPLVRTICGFHDEDNRMGAVFEGLLECQDAEGVV